MLYQLIYASTSIDSLDLNEVHNILSTANRENKRHDITGLLLWDSHTFLQCLEGRENEIDQLFTNINRDKRHHTIRLIDKKETSKREFEEWTMGFVNQKHLTRQTLLQNTDHSEFDPYRYHFSQALNLLKSLSKLI